MPAIAALRDASEFDAGIQGMSEGIHNPPAYKPGAQISSIAARFLSDFAHKFR
jgi:hypothetical protein